MAKKPVPLEPIRISPFMSNDDIRNAVLAREIEERSRMRILAAELGVSDPIDWYAVALRLAQQHCPELKGKQKKGRKKKWGHFELMTLAGEVKRIMQNDNKTRESACKDLAKQPPWFSFIEKKERVLSSDPWATLEQQFKNMPEWVKAIGEKAYLHHVATGTLDEWIKLVRTVRK